MVDPGADKGDEFVATLVDHEAADLALVTLLAEAPGREERYWVSKILKEHFF